MKTKTQKVSSGRQNPPVLMSLEYIAAKKNVEKYQGLSKEDYTKKLESMSNCDLSNYLPSVGIRPNGDRRMMFLAALRQYDEAHAIMERQESIARSTPQPEQTSKINDNYEKFIRSFR